MRTRLAAVGASLLLALGGTVMAAPAAHATAYSEVYYGGFSLPYKGTVIGIPAGWLNMYIEGKGYKASTWQSFAGYNPCYARVDLIQRTVGGTHHHTSRGIESRGCVWKVSQVRKNVIFYPETRNACAQILIDTKPKATTCRAIY
ncbi:MAG: hypothetical protein FWD18_01800 [Micrococcales bacterium]|nr:hypothetical protein [Micrococcales bacterium]